MRNQIFQHNVTHEKEDISAKRNTWRKQIFQHNIMHEKADISA
jgi:hypothetical protein